MTFIPVIHQLTPQQKKNIKFHDLAGIFRVMFKHTTYYEKVITKLSESFISICFHVLEHHHKVTFPITNTRYCHFFPFIVIGQLATQISISKENVLPLSFYSRHIKLILNVKTCIAVMEQVTVHIEIKYSFTQ